MYEIVPFFKENINRYSWIIFIIVQQILFLFYLKTNILFGEILFVDAMVLIFDLISIIYIYLACHIRKNNEIFLKKIIIYVSLICWQHFFVLNENNFWYGMGAILQPIVTYVFTIGSFNLLLYGKTDFKRKIDTFICIVLWLMMPMFLVNRTIFNFMYLILFAGLHLYPFLIMVFYRKYFNSILSKIRKECTLFSFFLLFLLCLIFVDEFVKIGLVYSNIGWYVVTITICVITYLRFVQEVLLVKSKNIVGKITLISSFIILLFVVLWMLILYQNVKRFDYIVLYLGLTELFMFIIVLYIKIYLEYRLYIRASNLENSKFISMLKIEEEIKEQFAEYLHDDILQSVIAVKNITQISCIENENKKLIVGELNSLVDSIRNEVDTQKPIINSDVNLKTVYRELINSLCKKYKTNKIVNFHCTDKLNIYSPYSAIIYRMIKELINNAIKYSDGYVANLYLDVRFDNIYIKINNITQNDEIKIGNGLNNLKKKVEFLKGKIDICIEDGCYYVDIIIPMERRICFENIVN